MPVEISATWGADAARTDVGNMSHPALIAHLYVSGAVYVAPLTSVHDS